MDISRLRRPECLQRLALTAGLVALTAAISVPATAGKLYRWVDKQGQVHFSDTVPPDEVGQGRQELNNEGMTVRTIKRAKTPAEIAAAKHEAELQAEQKRKEEEQAAKDRALLDTYSSVDMMIQARDGKLAAINGQIKLTQSNLKELRSQLDGFMDRAAALERRGKSIGKNLQRQISDTRLQIKRSREFIAQRKRERDAITKQFTSDIARYRVITSQDNKTSPTM